MTWRGIGPSGEIATIDVGGGTLSVGYKSASGDVSGLVNSLVVIGFRGRPVSSLAPISGDIYLYDGVKWFPSAASDLLGSGLHNLLSPTHPDTIPATVDDGDLIAGSGLSTAAWTKFPIGLPQQQLRVSNTVGLSWEYDPIEIVTTGSIFNPTQNNHRVVFNKTIGAPTLVNLPSGTFIGQELIIKDGKGDAIINPITILPPSGQMIDGETRILMRQNYQSFTFLNLGTSWSII